ncbi:hypothetical protein K353_05767 [Kitasatospora sp. SolWspMP-SS2h]|uniref:hypothetical protein n=1 Tax=Kitasatospora sp. SolWspMP-SS2h TaxID=1305729 RepID=UPI000DBF5F0A|nr:hypothetical protein [Kitasatospora sp. SolWspMP-SS2h]RAJ33123.1 hypothetical protein K353_05767 [Kitasatospora sp. SolWspMP-SS2h]
MPRQVSRRPGRRGGRTDRSRTVTATTAVASAVRAPAAPSTWYGVSTASSAPPSANPSTDAPPAVTFISDRAGAYPPGGTISASRPIRVPDPSDWKNPTSSSRPNRAASGSPGTACPSVAANADRCSATSVRRGRAPSATDISVNAPSTAANDDPYMLTAVRNGDPVRACTSTPSANPDSVPAPDDSANPAYSPANSRCRSSARYP